MLRSSRISVADRRLTLARTAVIIFVVALGLRSVLLISMPDLLPPAVDKATRYDPIAHALLAGDGFSQGGLPTAVAGPVHPLVLAAVYGLFGESQGALRALLALMDSLQCLLLFLIARRHFGEWVGRGTGLAMALCPYFIATVFYMGTETTFLFLHAGFLLLLGGGLAASSWLSIAGAGAVLGMATLTRPVSFLLPLALGALPVLLRRRGIFPPRRYALFLLATALVVGPWLVRNYVVFERFIPVQTMGGWHLYAGAGSPGERPAGNVWEPESDGRLYRRAIEGVWENKADFARRMGRRLLGMWYSTDSGGHTMPLLVINLPLLLLAGIGLWLTRRRWRELSYLQVALAYYIVLHSVMVVIFRYMLPVIPILILFAVVTLHRVVKGEVPPSPRRPDAPRLAGAGG